MMYSPDHYTEERSDLIFEIMNDYGFATIVTQEPDGLAVSHLPLILDCVNEQQTLLGHCARANPQWLHFASGRTLTVIFHGPHSYISPAWYQLKLDNVPTWNYATVHVQGTATIISASEQVYEVLRKTVEKFEGEYQTGWRLPATPNRALETLLNGIVAFRIEIKNIQAKFKLSQKQEAVVRENVIEQLAKISHEGSAVANYMRRVSKRETT
jgi:transcriptional regulator